MDGLFLFALDFCTNVCYNVGMTTIKLTRVGNSVGALLPKEALARLHVDAGDTLYLTESPDGYRLTPYDPEFADQMAVAEEVMKRRRAVLRELAK
jgi:putative addiction module antidote